MEKTIPLNRVTLYWTGYLLLFTLIEGSTDHDFMKVFRNELISLPPKIIFVWLVTGKLFDSLMNAQQRLKAVSVYVVLITAFALILRLVDNYIILHYFLTTWAKEPLFSAAPFLYNMIKLQFLLMLPFCVKLYLYFQRPAARTALHVRCARRMVSILFEDIAYAEAQGNYLDIFTTGGTYKTYLSISELEEQLPASQFMRVHRSFVVALDKIKSHNHNQVVIADKKIPIGRSYAQARKNFR